MDVVGQIEHRLAGRARLRFVARKGNPEFFARVSQTLLGCPGVSAVRCNAQTGSVLVLHGAEMNLDAILDYGRERGLFGDMIGAEPVTALPKSIGEIAAEGLKAMNVTLSDTAAAGLDGKSVGNLTDLLGMGARELVTRANLVPPAAMLLWRSLGIIRSVGRKQV